MLTVVKWKWGVAYQGRVTARFWEARAWYLTSRRSLSTRLVTRENHDIPTDSRSTVVKPLASPTAICTALLGQRLRLRTQHEPPRAHLQHSLWDGLEQRFHQLQAMHRKKAHHGAVVPYHNLDVGHAPRAYQMVRIHNRGELTDLCEARNLVSSSRARDGPHIHMRRCATHL